MEMTAAAEREYGELLSARRPHAISNKRAYNAAMHEIKQLTKLTRLMDDGRAWSEDRAIAEAMLV